MLLTKGTILDSKATLETSKKSWDDMAEFYNKNMEANTLPAALLLWSLLGKPKYSSLLEAGCGSGLFLDYLLKEANAQCSIICSDISEKMVEIASRDSKALLDEKKSKFSIELDFKVGPNEDLSFVPSESLDVYISNLTIHLVSDEKIMLSEALRVLKSGGKLGLSVPVYEGNMMLVAMEAFRSVTGMEKMGPAPGVKPFHFTRESLAEVVKEAGFEVRSCYETFIATSYYTDEDYLTLLSAPNFQKILSTLSEENRQQVLKNYMSHVEKLRKEYRPSGVGMILLSATKP